MGPGCLDRARSPTPARHELVVHAPVKLGHRSAARIRLSRRDIGCNGWGLGWRAGTKDLMRGWACNAVHDCQQALAGSRALHPTSHYPAGKRYLVARACWPKQMLLLCRSVHMARVPLSSWIVAGGRHMAGAVGVHARRTPNHANSAAQKGVTRGAFSEARQPRCKPLSWGVVVVGWPVYQTDCLSTRGGSSNAPTLASCNILVK